MIDYIKMTENLKYSWKMYCHSIQYDQIHLYEASRFIFWKIWTYTV